MKRSIPAKKDRGNSCVSQYLCHRRNQHNGVAAGAIEQKQREIERYAPDVKIDEDSIDGEIERIEIRAFSAPPAHTEETSAEYASFEGPESVV